MGRLTPRRVAYVLEAPYPAFAVTEVLALRHRGVHVTVLNSFRPFPQGDPEADALQSESFYFPTGYRGVLLATMKTAVLHPYAFSRALAAVCRHRLPVQLLLLSAHYARLLRMQGVRHVHGMYGTTPATVALLVSWMSGLPFSFTCHSYEILLPNPLLTWKARTARFLTTISDFNRDFICTTYPGIPDSKVRVVRLGVDLDQWQAPAAEGEPPLVLSVASLVPVKGHVHLVRALNRLREWHVDFQALFVGDGPVRRTIEAEVRRLGLASRVRLVGNVPHREVADVVRRCSVFVLHGVVDERGNHDGIPVALMEAMAAGKAVVSTRVSGIPELVEHERTGLLVEERDEEALASAMRRLLLDRDQREALGKAARERVSRDYTLDRCASEMERLFFGQPST